MLKIQINSPSAKCNMLIFQIILPIFSPLADLFMLFSLLSGLFSLSEVNGISLIYIISQRFFWRQLMYIVLFRSLKKALKGELTSWGTLKWTGNMKEI